MAAGSLRERHFCSFLSVVTLSAAVPALADTPGISLHSFRCCPGNSEGQLLKEKALERVCQDPGNKEKELEQSQTKKQSKRRKISSTLCSGMFLQGVCPRFTVSLDNSWVFYFTWNPLLGFEGLRKSHPLLLT